ncbi:MAG: hypothetical protein NW223_04640 [Hyphomicrobiaceae bacterium]|nr:hypothetical protein [Hyphomicrobiaceae bacterium]
MLVVLLACLTAGAGRLHAQACAKADFEAVVDEAAGALRVLNQQNTPAFQGKLRQLKDKRGWSHDEFMTQAAPFVRDETIAGFDGKSEELLSRITSGGQSGAAAAPDCGRLKDLRAQMDALVETQKAKWGYMFGKIEQELKK